MMTQLARRIKTTDNGLTDLFAYASNPDLISFAGGYPNDQLFPKAELQAAFSDTLATGDATLFQYTSTSGLESLRTKFAKRAEQAGVQATAANVLLTQGAQQGIDLTAKLLLNPGDGMVVEGPTYLGALSAFDAYEPTYYEAPMEDDGLDVNELQKILMTHSVKFIYTIPDFQNPTGVTMSLEKRKALVRLANQYDVIILEDTPYRDLRFSGAALPAIKSFDTEGRVIMLGSCSKILSPSLRLGWLIADEKLLKPITALKLASDVQSSNLTMRAVDRYLTDNDLDQHIQAMNTAYATKKDAMMNAIKTYFPEKIHVVNPAGGFFIFIQNVGNLDMTQFLKQTMLAENIAYVPSEHLFSVSNTKNAARLNYTNLTEKTIQLGIQKLGGQLKQHLAQTNWSTDIQLESISTN
nr:PLP-dependent aminotransferase family protein [Loigolactobacillus backii]